MRIDFLLYTVCILLLIALGSVVYAAVSWLVLAARLVL